MATVAIQGGRVLPITSAPIEAGVVIIRDGIISAIGGPETPIPPDAEVYDATGQWVMPGLVEGHAHIGIHEEGEGWAGNDTNEMTAANMARVRAIDAINIDDEGFRDALAGGVTTAVIKPGSGNPIGGYTVAMKTWGGRTIDEQVISSSVSIKSALGENPKRVHGEAKRTPSTRLGVAAILRDAFVEAANYIAKRDAAAAKDEPFERDLTKEAIARVLTGELVWDQHCHRHDDIVTAIRISEEFGYKLVVNHGTEGGKIADVLAEKQIPVIFGPIFTSRSKVELRDRTPNNAGIMAAAGVELAITTDHPVVPINFLIYQVIIAVKEGLDREVGLAAVTHNPAHMLGLDKRVGALEPGLDGDVVVWSGDPLDINSRALRVYIDGVLQYWYDDGPYVLERFV